MSAPAIELNADMEEFFGEVLKRAVAARSMEATDAACRYVVGLLCDFAKPDRESRPVLERSSTLLWREALEARGATRFRRLRQLGDGILYVLGFFGSSVRRRGADPAYVMTVGSSAYSHAAAMLRLGGAAAQGPDVLGELADKYSGFVEVLNDVAELELAGRARSDGGVLLLYERWRRTGSERLAEQLGELGLVPLRRRRGVH